MAYVHWYLENGDSNAERYEARMRDFRNQTLSNKMKEIFTKRIKATTNSEWQDFLDFSSALIGDNNSMFHKSVQEAFNSLSRFETLSKMGIKDIEKNIKDEKSLRDLAHSEKIFKQMDEFINYASKFYSSQSGQDFLSFLIAEGKGYDKKAINSKMQQIINSKQAHIFDRTDEEMSRGASNKFIELKRILESSNQDFCKYAIKEFQSKVQTNPKMTLGKVINYYYRMMHTLIGYMYEQMINTFLNVELISQMKKGLPSGVSILATNISDNLTGGKTSLSFHTPTTDLTLAGQNGSIKFKFPVGFSIKKSSGSDASKFKDLHIKSSSIGKLLELSRAYGLWNESKYGEAFYNIMANHGRHKTTNSKGGGGNGSYYYYENNTSDDSLAPILNKMNKMFTLFGIAGSLTSDDLGSYIIVNNRIYSIYDIISRIDSSHFKAGGLSKSSQRNIRAQHRFLHLDGKDKDNTPSIELGKTRSTNIIQSIFNETIFLKLNLDLKKLSLNKI